MRSIRLRARHRSDGFSLIEVLVALAIIGMAIVTLVQIFSQSLRATKQSAEYTIALIHARSLMEEAYAEPSLEDIEDTFDFDDGYSATRTVEEVPPPEQEGEKTKEGTAAAPEAPIPFKYYEITVTVKWPPKGSTILRGRRVIYEEAT